MKTSSIFSSLKAFFFIANCLIFNQLGHAQGCTLPAPNNFLASTQGNTVKLTWQPQTGTAGFRVEVFNLTTGLFFFTGNAGAAATSFTVSGIDPKHRYLATLRAKCPSNCVSGGSLSGNPTAGAAGRVIVEDVIFFTGGCNNPCPGNDQYDGQLAGITDGSLLWEVPGQKNVRSIYFLRIFKNGQTGGSSTLKIGRDAGVTNTINYAECGIDNNCNCAPDGFDTIRCRRNGGAEICKIWFSQPDNIHFLRSNNWKVDFKKETCTLPFGLGGNFDGGDEPEFLLTSPENDGPKTAPAELLIVPNPASNDVEFRFQLVETEPVTLEIFTPMGQLVELISENEALEKGANNLRFDASKLPSGSYFVSLRGATWQSAARFEKI